MEITSFHSNLWTIYIQILKSQSSLEWVLKRSANWVSGRVDVMLQRRRSRLSAV